MTGYDVLVIGGGPAGFAATAALAERGVSTALIAPEPVHWPARYGAWVDEMESLGFSDAVERTWPTTLVRLGERAHRLRRGYAMVDNAALAHLLRARAEDGGAHRVVGRAADVEHHSTESRVVLRSGRALSASLVIDASGHRPVLTRHPASPPPAYQTAVGLTFHTDTPLLADDEALLMDWDDSHLSTAERGGVPSFLYAMTMGEGRLFAEETALAARPAVPVRALEERLVRRLHSRGVRLGKIVARERVWIPMGGAIPSRSQRVVGFGGAARMVHPATGYLLTRVLRDAPALADAVARGLGAGLPPQQVARTAWEALWPSTRCRQHALHRFGMEALLHMDGAGMRDFFDSFFQLPENEWKGYLDARFSTPELCGAMARLFARAPVETRLSLARTALGAQGARLLASLLSA